MENFASGAQKDGLFIGFTLMQIFSKNEMINCSATGKKGKANDVKPPLNEAKLNFVRGNFKKM
jgi:hypothetical protein